MVHNLAEIDGEYAFAYAGNRPGWHGLGQAIPEGMETSEHVIRHAKLDWEVGLAKTYIHAQDASEPSGFRPIEVPDHFAIVRLNDGHFFDVVGARYTPIQNYEAFDALDSWLADGRMTYETAGAINGGKTVFILGRIGEDFLVGGKDPITPYVLCVNSHGGNIPAQVKLCSTRVVCQNTLAVATKEHTTSVRIWHTPNALTRLARANESLQLISRQQQEMFNMFDQMAQITVTGETREKIIDLVAPKAKEDATERIISRADALREQFVQLMYTSPTVAAAGGIDNAYGVLNAVTEWIDWLEPRKGSTVGDVKTLEKRMTYSLDGAGADIRQSAFELLSVGVI